MLLLNPGGWSLRLRLRAEPGPGLEEREGEAWVGMLGTGEGVVQACRASPHLLWADTQQQPCLRPAGPSPRLLWADTQQPGLPSGSPGPGVARLSLGQGGQGVEGDDTGDSAGECVPAYPRGTGTRRT